MSCSNLQDDGSKTIPPFAVDIILKALLQTIFRMFRGEQNNQWLGQPNH